MSDFITVSGTTITSYHQSAHDVPGGIIVNIRTLLETVPLKYLKWVDPNVLEMSAGEKSAVDTAIAAAQTAAEKAAASAVIDRLTEEGRALRALAEATLSEVNILRAWLAQSKVEVAAATNLADFKTRWATLPATPPRTNAQLRTVYLNVITAE